MNLFEGAKSAHLNMRVHETRLSCLIPCCFIIACAVLLVLDRTKLDRIRKLAQLTELIDMTPITPITVTLDIAPIISHNVTPIEAPSKVRSISHPWSQAGWSHAGNHVFYFAVTHSSGINSKLDASLQT